LVEYNGNGETILAQKASKIINTAIKWGIKTLQAAKIAGIISYVGEKNNTSRLKIVPATVSGESDFVS
jgi:hypothetical protein